VGVNEVKEVKEVKETEGGLFAGWPARMTLDLERQLGRNEKLGMTRGGMVQQIIGIQRKKK
jgi:hypothetical protein